MESLSRPYLLDKPLGATPLQALTLFRRAFNIPDATKLAYAGRLDPLATGLLAVLSSEQLSHQEDYWYLPKQYEAYIVLGVATDSFDLMGVPVYAGCAGISAERVTTVVRSLVGKVDLSVPIFSSQRYQGQALFSLARDDKAAPFIVPVRRMVISQMTIEESDQIAVPALVDRAVSHIGLVEGDFRQSEICEAWSKLQEIPDELLGLRVRIHCGSGTYVRSVANEIGRRLGVGAVLAGLRRTAIGSWHIDDPTIARISWPQ